VADSRQFPVIFVRRWQPFCSVALAALLQACRLVGGGQPSPQIQARARLLRIEDTRRDEPAYVDSLLASTDARTRADAALAVGRIGARQHVDRLRRLATDADTAVAANALFSLGLLDDSASAAIAATALHRGEPTGIEAAWLLGRIGDRGRAALVAALGESTLSSATRAAVILAASRLRPVPASALVPLLSSPDAALAWRAAYAVVRGRGISALRQLLSISGSPSSDVREQVAGGATRRMAGDSLAVIARAALDPLLHDANARVRINAVRSIASYGPSARAVVVAALHDTDAGVRLTAAQGLSSVLDSASAAWIAAFDGDTSFTVRRAIADGAIRYRISLAARAGWATSADWHLRAAAAELDGFGVAAEAAERLIHWMQDQDPHVRAAAAGAEAQLADSAAVKAIIRARLRSALADADVFVRTAALDALAKDAIVNDLAAALAEYPRSVGDADSDARLSFWKLADSALAHSAGVLPDSVAHTLDALPRPPDPLERILASHIRRFAAWGDSTGAARPLAWYEERAREAAAPPPTLVIETGRGTMELALFNSEAPLTVYNIVSLAKRGYFDGLLFHRVVPNFVIQTGDPRGDGSGGPGYAIRDEINRRRYIRGTLGMALSGPNTGGSQFFVTHSPQPHLDGGYTVFGQLLSGGNVLDRIVQGDRIVRITVR
jgi:cyclophilin family peptidyl-prolyl cis-trans isomerase/HEAT repeat protein